MSRITIKLGTVDNSGKEFNISSSTKIRFMNTTGVDINLTTGAGFLQQGTTRISAGTPNTNRSQKFRIESDAEDLKESKVGLSHKERVKPILEM